MGGKIIISDSYLVTIATQHNYNLITIQDEVDALLVPDRFIIHVSTGNIIVTADFVAWIRVVLLRNRGTTPAFDITGTALILAGKVGEEIIAVHTQRIGNHFGDAGFKAMELFWDFNTRRELEQKDAITLAIYVVGTSGTLEISLDANIMWE